MAAIKEKQIIMNMKKMLDLRTISNF